MDENKLKISLESLQKVQEYKLNNNYGRAFAHYLVFLELSPNDRCNHELEFFNILSTWCMILEERNQINNLYKCYLQGLHYYPSCVDILNNFGAHLIRFEEELEAKKYLELGYKLNKDFLPVEKNLATVKLNLVQRWHFRMLNDIKRNKSYCKAIQSQICDKFNKILDIGTGCGLLSLFASQNKATKSITAIEQSKVMSDIATEIFKVNEIHNVQIINKKSTDLTSKNLELSNLLITEIFDTALFGEHVLETLIHAHENLLEKNAKILPQSASVFITGIECEHILKKHKFINSNLNGLNLSNICLTQEITEPYEAENINNLNYKEITNTYKFIDVNFADIEQLKNIYTNKHFLEPFDLNFIVKGNLHAFIIWFELNLDDNNSITNNPHKDDVKCWEQAIIYIDHPIPKEINDSLHLKISCANDKLEIDILNQVINCDKCFKVSPDVITFLNEKDYIKAIQNTSESIQKSNLIILDLYPIPILGLSLINKGAQVFSLASPNNIEFINYICDINKINLNNITFICEDELYQYLCCKNIFDIILFDPIAQNGTINEKFLSNFQLFKSSLKENGLMLPCEVNLHLNVIESNYLDNCVKVDDCNTFGFKVAEYINEYMVFEQWMLEPNFPHKILTNTLIAESVLINDLNPKQSMHTIDVVDKGKANAILYWFDIHMFGNIRYNTYNSIYYNNACFILDQTLPLNVGDQIKVNIKQHKGLLKIYVT